MSRRISQREARRTAKELDAYVDAFNVMYRAWGQEFVNGVEIARCMWQSAELIPTAIRTARKLKHAVVAIGDDGGLVRFVALPLPKVKP